MATHSEIVLFDFPADPGLPGYGSFSPFVLQVERALRLADLPFRHERIQMQNLKSLNPVGQLPVVGFGEERVAGSTAIFRRIEALVPGALSGGLVGAAAAESWLWKEFGDTALYPHVLYTRWQEDRGFAMVRSAFFGAMPAPLRMIIAPMVRGKIKTSLIGRDFTRGGDAALLERMGRVLDQLEERAPERGFWLGGDKPSAADLGLFGPLHELRIPKTPWRAEEVARRGRLSRWLDRVDAATRG